jgi:hypothetical protein
MHKKEWHMAPPYLLQFSNTSGELEHTSESALHCVGADYWKYNDNAGIFRRLPKAVAKSYY